MKPYKTKDNEKLIYSFTIKENNKTVNIVTVYCDENNKVFIHNTNGIKQDICPYMRYSGIFYCQKYSENFVTVPIEFWKPITTTPFLFVNLRNPKYQNCSELGMNAEDYKNCKYYKEVLNTYEKGN